FASRPRIDYASGDNRRGICQRARCRQGAEAITGPTRASIIDMEGAGMKCPDESPATGAIPARARLHFALSRGSYPTRPGKGTGWIGDSAIVSLRLRALGLRARRDDLHTANGSPRVVPEEIGCGNRHHAAGKPFEANVITVVIRSIAGIRSGSLD